MQIRRPEILIDTWLALNDGDENHEHCALGHLMVEVVGSDPVSLESSEGCGSVPISYWHEARIEVEEILGVTRTDTEHLVEDNDNVRVSHTRIDRLGEWLQQHGHSYITVEEADAI
jgi:hypothetical protein